MTFKIGDVVTLKSGGPTMTVHELGDYSPTGPANGADCVWFDGAKKMSDVFHVDALQRYDPSAQEYAES